MTLARLTVRVNDLETKMTTLAENLETVTNRTTAIEKTAAKIEREQVVLVNNTQEILDIVSGMKKTGGFLVRNARRWGPHIGTALVSAGIVTGKLATFLKAVLSPLAI